ncbi:DUF4307 domain-containing protein [Cellulomonas sp. PhB143]|uniref:DUF4307 domain-containing protein n=1 Tax=Cellulomonas sp. PhB143 TaxID=2485186 RepID=UPI000F48AA32|nr:DUF4307 domain-containing protein [Cellulomonas sp. PhB143]ROS78623.1 uncharacterized protein DUF4307 [Cellulomonas sp. PhB143]
MTQHDLSTDDLPAGRYGPATRGPRRRVRLGRFHVPVTALVLAALVVLGTLAVAWLSAENAKDSVDWQDVGFSIQGPEQVDSTFDVTMAPGTTAVCTVQALDPGFAEVGSLDVTVGPNPTRTARYTVSVSTSQEATTAVVKTCDAQD